MNRRLIVALIAALAALGWLGSTRAAYAGGPTSVLAVNLDTGAAAGLYHTNGTYDRLVEALDAYGANPAAVGRPSSISEDAAPNTRLTWLIHDQSIWRFDQIYLVGDDIWVQTALGGEASADPAAPTRIWHRPAQADLLRSVLRSLDDQAGRRSSVDTTPAAVPPITQVATVPSSGRSTHVAIGAGLGGLVIGASSALLWRRRARPENTVLEG